MNNQTIIRKLLVFIAIYLGGLAILQIPPVRTTYVGAYNFIQASVFNIFHPSVHTGFNTYSNGSGAQENFDYTLTISNKKSKENPIARINQSAGKTAVVPFTLLIALLIIGPGSTKRKIAGGLIIALLLYIILAMKYTLLIDQNAPQLSPENSIWISTTKSLQGIYRTHESLYVIIVASWILITWTSENIKHQFNRNTP